MADYNKSLKYGMFMEHTYNGPGLAPPTQKGGTEEMSDREGGLNLKASSGRTGKVSDASGIACG